MNIVLIGMRGAGKTTVAKILAKKLQLPYIEMDQIIVDKTNMTIPKMVEKFGWDYFRKKESEAVKGLAEKDNYIISTGGGVVLQEENVVELKKHGNVIWLQVSIKTLLQRIGNDTNRPSLTDQESRKSDMQQTLQERYHLYQNAANDIIDTDGISPEDVAEKIIQIV